MVGEVPCAAIVLKKGRESVQGELVAEMHAVLKKNELPKSIKILSQIPLLTSSKPDKSAIKSLFC